MCVLPALLRKRHFHITVILTLEVASSFTLQNNKFTKGKSTVLFWTACFIAIIVFFFYSPYTKYDMK